MEDCPEVMEEANTLLSKLRDIALIIPISFSLASTAFNIILIASFIGTKQINKNTTNFLILITSANDLLLGCLSLPTIAIGIYVHNLCSLFMKGFLALSTLGMYSALLTTQVALDRYLHMDPNVLNTSKWRRRFKKCFQKPQIYASLLFSAIIAMLYAWYIYERMNAVDELQSILRIIEVIVGITGLSFLAGLHGKKSSNFDIVFSLYIRGKRTISLPFPTQNAFYTSNFPPSFPTGKLRVKGNILLPTVSRVRFNVSKSWKLSLH